MCSGKIFRDDRNIEAYYQNNVRDDIYRKKEILHKYNKSVKKWFRKCYKSIAKKVEMVIFYI